MTVMTPELATAIPRPAPADLRQLIANGPDPAAAAALLQWSGPISLRVERVHFPTDKPVQFQIRATTGTESALLIGEWLGGDVIGVAAVEAVRLAKPRRGQTDAERPAVVADPASGLILRRAGFDTKLPGLRLLYDPAFAAERLGILGLDAGRYRLSLVGHRLGKRAVIRVSRLRRDWYLRLRAVTSASGEDAHARHQTLWQALDGNPDLSIPRPLGFDPVSGAALYDALPGRAPVFAGLTGFRNLAALIPALNALQGLHFAAPPHSATDELAILTPWAARLRDVFPELARKADPILSRLRRELPALAPVAPVLCHRDLHEGQILVNTAGRAPRIGLLDFDTVRLGDPALDPGNLQAHLILAGLREGRSHAPFVDAIERALPHIAPERLAQWRRAALLRVAMIHAFSAEPRPVIAALLAEAAAS
ncbi:MAG: phosphotransferase family protein [Paracoccaceae bacterium]